MIFKRFFYAFLFTVVFVSYATTLSAQAIRIAVVSDHCDPQELSAMTAMLQHNPQFSVRKISLRDLSKPAAINAFTHVWYHRTDTTGFTADEKAVGAAIQPFVSKGGNVFLSMEAVPLLN